MTGSWRFDGSCMTHLLKPCWPQKPDKCLEIDIFLSHKIHKLTP
ncbi:hypothetical protein MIZ03_1565 [Rhodoferax lithotrophicus]|uniref:Uncharacterized protein n=1 Tax=Rhodoferax lithotrophicus TaxID=2798804 RepID=A0ABN6D3U8_9BURK|nr:hypothetical protein MIZ03_1565 [Rhodoferax sp. MIZ03]